MADMPSDFYSIFCASFSLLLQGIPKLSTCGHTHAAQAKGALINAMCALRAHVDGVLLTTRHVATLRVRVRVLLRSVKHQRHVQLVPALCPFVFELQRWCQQGEGCCTRCFYCGMRELDMCSCASLVPQSCV